MRQGLQSVCNLQQLLGLDVGVGLQVGLQVGPLVETALTDGTPMGSLLVVKYLVNCQGPRLTESFPAVRAFKWFLFGMYVAVIPGIGRLTREHTAGQRYSPQVILSSESFTTDITGIRPRRKINMNNDH